MISFAASKSGFDGTDVRLLKFLANKVGFSYNITKPDNYQAAIKMVCHLNFFFANCSTVLNIFSVKQPRGRYMPNKSNVEKWYCTS